MTVVVLILSAKQTDYVHNFIQCCKEMNFECKFVIKKDWLKLPTVQLLFRACFIMKNPQKSKLLVDPLTVSLASYGSTHLYFIVFLDFYICGNFTSSPLLHRTSCDLWSVLPIWILVLTQNVFSRLLRCCSVCLLYMHI